MIGLIAGVAAGLVAHQTDHSIVDMGFRLCKSILLFSCFILLP